MAGTLERAIAIAAQAHEGQLDKAGAPYILHPLRTMLSLSSPEARMAAVLHDVVEDGEVTFEQLRAEGFAAVVVEAVEALTKREGEGFPRSSGVAPNALAREVKLADLRDNSDLSRITQPIGNDRARLEKYKKAIACLEAVQAGRE